MGKGGQKQQKETTLGELRTGTYSATSCCPFTQQMLFYFANKSFILEGQQWGKVIHNTGTSSLIPFLYQQTATLPHQAKSKSGDYKHCIRRKAITISFVHCFLRSFISIK